MDLIIATLKLPCVGQLETTSVLPCAGLGAFDHQPGQVALSLQLFAHLGQQPRPLYVLQQRAPAAKGCQQQYAQDLAQWVSNSKFGEVQTCKGMHSYIHVYLVVEVCVQDMHGLVEFGTYCQAGCVSAAFLHFETAYRSSLQRA